MQPPRGASVLRGDTLPSTARRRRVRHRHAARPIHPLDAAVARRQAPCGAGAAHPSAARRGGRERRRVLPPTLRCRGRRPNRPAAARGHPRRRPRPPRPRRRSSRQLVTVERRAAASCWRSGGRRSAPPDGGAFRSFPRGMATLVDALLGALPSATVRLATCADTMHHDGSALAGADHGWRHRDGRCPAARRTRSRGGALARAR